jgi:hypothetical protein
VVALDKAGNIIAAKTSLGTVETETLNEEKRIRDALLLTEGVETNHDLTQRGG